MKVAYTQEHSWIVSQTTFKQNNSVREETEQREENDTTGRHVLIHQRVPSPLPTFGPLNVTTTRTDL